LGHLAGASFCGAFLGVGGGVGGVEGVAGGDGGEEVGEGGLDEGG